MNSRTFQESKGLIIFIVVIIFFALLTNFIVRIDAIRDFVIDFMTPVLERFYHQPEMDIVQIELFLSEIVSSVS